MIIIADTHVHIYPNYSLDVFLRECFRKVLKIKQSLNVEMVSCICLTEVIGCNYYKDLTNKLGNEFIGYDFDGFKVIEFKGESLYVFPGYQINTIEKIEVLELFTEDRVSSGKSLEETIALIEEKNSFPVISWSFGKWVGKRGELIRNFIKKGEYKFALGDSALRFILHPIPKIFNIGIKNNLRVIYGSDPLPINGEESTVFDYYSVCDDFNIQSNDKKLIGEAIREAIINQSLRSSGKRNSFFKFLSRWLRVMVG